MSIGLTNDKGESFSFRNLEWGSIMTLAYFFAWKPAGIEYVDVYETGIEETDKCNMDYFSNSFQRVEAQDASNIAEAIEKACKEGSLIWPNQTPDITALETIAKRNGASADDWNRLRDIAPRLADSYSQEQLGSFVQFCRQGGFIIF